MKTFKQYLLEMKVDSPVLNMFSADYTVVPGEGVHADGPRGQSIAHSESAFVTAREKLKGLGIVPESDHIHHWKSAFDRASNVIISGNHTNEEIHKMTIPEKTGWMNKLHHDILKAHAGTADGFLTLAHLFDQGTPITLTSVVNRTAPPPPPPSK
jgi:hypothetical protein